MENHELKNVLQHIKNHIKKFDEENFEKSSYLNWCAGITDNPEEKKEMLEKIAKVEYFEKWDLGSMENAIDLRNKLISEMGLKPFVVEKSIQPNVIKVSELKFNAHANKKESIKYVFIFKN